MVEPSVPRPVGDGVDRVLRHLVGARGRVVTSIFSSWSVVVGKELAGTCRPVSLDGGTLTIAARDAAAAESLRWSTADLLRTLNGEFGEGTVVDVRVVVSPPS